MIGWAVVGFGDITRRRVIPALREEPRSRLRAVVTRGVSRDPETARAECHAFGVERVYSTLEEALADREVTAVYIGTPVALHYPQAMAAFAAGKHVLCEKPTALNPQHVTAMIAASKAAERIFGVSFYRRLFPVVARVRELLRGGVIGQPTLAWICQHSWFNDDVLPHRAWLFDPALSGGGPLMDVGSHRIDLLNYLFGEPKLAGAAISRQVQQTPNYKVEDSATLTIEYTGEFGPLRAVLDVRWNSEVTRDEFRVVGTKGELIVTPLSEGLLRYPGGEELHPPHENFHLPMVAHFANALEDAVPLISSGETAIATDRIMSEAYASSGGIDI
jgi:1,5-anhydro-D-fructose reductase (1,5-anhydro-D-mannitol-forming)